jgi:hypothetical protein
MSYTPPFTIAADIVNLVANISEQVDASWLNASPQWNNCLNEFVPQSEGQIPWGHAMLLSFPKTGRR